MIKASCLVGYLAVITAYPSDAASFIARDVIEAYAAKDNNTATSDPSRFAEFVRINHSSGQNKLRMQDTPPRRTAAPDRLRHASLFNCP
jgi:hypothetical protein